MSYFSVVLFSGQVKHFMGNAVLGLTFFICSITCFTSLIDVDTRTSVCYAFSILVASLSRGKRLQLKMPKNGTIECSVCHSKLLTPSPRTILKAYDRHRSKISKKHHALNYSLVVGDCILVGLQVIQNMLAKLTLVAYQIPYGVNLYIILIFWL